MGIASHRMAHGVSPRWAILEFDDRHKLTVLLIVQFLFDWLLVNDVCCVLDCDLRVSVIRAVVALDSSGLMHDAKGTAQMPTGRSLLSDSEKLSLHTDRLSAGCKTHEAPCHHLSRLSKSCM